MAPVNHSPARNKKTTTALMKSKRDWVTSGRDLVVEGIKGNEGDTKCGMGRR